MFPKIRLDNGRSIIVGSHAVGLRAAPVTGVERRVGTLKICSVIVGTWRVRQGRMGCPMRLFQLPHPLLLRREGGSFSFDASSCFFGHGSLGCF